jgi:uncharacterized protein
MNGFRENTLTRRYEFDDDGVVSFADYADQPGARVILHVETPSAARGNGHAAKLMAAIVADARARGLKLSPRCSYAVVYFERHPDAEDVRA